MARRQQLFQHPLCQYRLEDGTECGLVADSVHHIVELEDGGAPREPDNLMSVCRSHHSVIHARRRGGEGRRMTASDPRAPRVGRREKTQHHQKRRRDHGRSGMAGSRATDAALTGLSWVHSDYT